MKKLKFTYLIIIPALCLFAACNPPSRTESAGQEKVSDWPRGVTYEIFVQSFCDSDQDGIGDIKGMTSKLDYLEELGIEAVWLMPMSPSPSYHKYDVTNYYDIHPDYGTLEDFKEFVDQAHQRGIHVVIDLVLNHSGSGHPWFKEAAGNEQSPYRDYYVWAHKDDPQTQGEGKIIAGDSDNVNRWHKVEGSDYLYYGYFYGGMPDLNYDNPEMRQEAFKIGRFWLEEVGVDGFRLDAARHIFTDDRPADNHQFWEEFRAEMQKVKEDVYLVGEVWADSKTVAPYTKGLPALFNFEMSWSMLQALQEGEGDSLAIKHAGILDFYEDVNPEFIDATMLSNHDQNRIMSELDGDVEKAKMAAGLLLTLPGSPYIYYGEEIGMQGKKPDEQIREPFLWDVAAQDNCRASWIEPVYTTEETVTPATVQAEEENSLLNHYKALIRLRNHSRALTYGEVEPVAFDNPAVSAFRRTASGESVLVLHNLSASELSLPVPSELAGYETVMFEHNNAALKNNELSLPAYSSLILRK